jgi:hypothetical protein
VLKWLAVPGATGYECQLSVNSSFISFAAEDSTTDTTFTTTALQNFTKYYWRVRAYNDTAVSPFSTIGSFTVVTSVPGVPTLIYPENNQTGVRTDTLTLKWNSAPGAFVFECQFAKNASFTPLLVTYDSTADTTLRVTSLSDSTKYFWRVRAFNIHGAGAFTATDSFTTALALSPVPVLVYPTSDQRYVRADTLRLLWHRAGGALVYVCDVSEFPSFSALVPSADTTTVDTSFLVTSLKHFTKYYWRVRSYRSYLVSFESSPDSFTTIVAIPPAPALASPPDNAAGVARLTRFAWYPSEFATTYRLQIAANLTFTTVIFDTTVADTAMGLTTPLSANTVYYWHVSAADTVGTGSNSVISVFATGTALGVTDADALPKKFALLQNYPNPFNPTSQIQYAVPRQSYVSLKVYNPLGQEVATLFAGTRAAGNYVAVFDGTGLSTGVYFYQMRAGSFVSTKKFLLLK